MIQFNLLPDVKLEYIKATYRKRIITLFCFIAAGAFLTIFILMFLFVRVNQTKHLSDLDKDIKANVAQIQKNPDLDKILTIQNQLNSLPALHEQKVMSSRMFQYLAQVTPNQASINDLDVDFEAKSITLKGTADSTATVNKFIDTLKFTDYKIEGQDGAQKAFGSVVLQNFTIDNKEGNQSSGSGVAYEITFSYQEDIFKNTAKEGDPVANGVTLTVPKIITTRSETQKPTNLFQPNTNTPENGGGN